MKAPLDKSNLLWLQRAFFLSATPPKSICVIDGPLPAGFKIDQVTSDRRAELSQMKLSEFIYVRASLRYWFAPGTFSAEVGTKGNGYFIPEVPPELVTPCYREGYQRHLLSERAEDEAAMGTEGSRASLQDRVAQIANWLEGDKLGEMPSLQAFLDFKTQESKPAPNPPPEATDLNEIAIDELFDLEAELEVSSTDEDDKAESPVDEAMLLAPEAPLSEQPLSPEGMNFLVERPLRDAGHHKEADEYKSQILKLSPDLGVCLLCGEKNHTTSRCYRKSTGPPASGGESWYKAKAGSIVALEAQGFQCAYTYCRISTRHALASCASLHQRCKRCRARGHGDQVWEYPEHPGFYQTYCPHVAQDRNSSGVVSTYAPTWSDLLGQFESWASSGCMTRFRYHSVGCGFFPIHAEGDLQIAHALGYTWLKQLSAEEAVTLLATIHALCINAFGEQSLRYTALSDEIWDEVYRSRAAKRSHDYGSPLSSPAGSVGKGKTRVRSPAVKRSAHFHNITRMGYHTSSPRPAVAQGPGCPESLRWGGPITPTKQQPVPPMHCTLMPGGHASPSKVARLENSPMRDSVVQEMSQRTRKNRKKRGRKPSYGCKSQQP